MFDGFDSYLGQTLYNTILSMSINLNHWAKEYDNIFDYSPIRYIDSTETEAEETDAQLNNISQAIQERSEPHIDRQELRSIGEWKTSGRRIDHHLRSNTADEVVTTTKAAFVPNARDADRVEVLTDLTGVGVPVASAILTMHDPKEFAVIDFRALRSLAIIHPSLVDTSNYSTYAAFVRRLLNYKQTPESTSST
jgi:hypothetical protein